MDYNVEFKITLPEELLETFGIDVNTIFDAYFEDGCIKVRIVDESELTTFDEEIEEVEFDECIGCPYFCKECGICTYDE